MRLLKLDRLAIVADTHMGDGGPGDAFLPNAGLFVKFCDYCLREERTLLIDGDVWELLGFEWESIIARHMTAMGAMVRLANENLLILLMGNHDLGAGVMKGFLPRVVWDSIDIESGDIVIHVEHGHRYDDLCAHPNWLQSAATQVGIWFGENKAKKEAERYRRIDDALKTMAGRLLARKEYGAVVFGHSHTLTDETYSTKDGIKRYYNPGAWGASLPHCVMVNEGRIELSPVIARKEVVVDDTA